MRYDVWVNGLKHEAISVEQMRPLLEWAAKNKARVTMKLVQDWK